MKKTLAFTIALFLSSGLLDAGLTDTLQKVLGEVIKIEEGALVVKEDTTGTEYLIQATPQQLQGIEEHYRIEATLVDSRAQSIEILGISMEAGPFVFQYIRPRVRVPIKPPLDVKATPSKVSITMNFCNSEGIPSTVERDIYWQGKLVRRNLTFTGTGRDNFIIAHKYVNEAPTSSDPILTDSDLVPDLIPGVWEITGVSGDWKRECEYAMGPNTKLDLSFCSDVISCNCICGPQRRGMRYGNVP